MTDKNKRKLYLRIVLIGAMAPLIAWLLARAYQPSTTVWELLRFGGDLIAPSGAVPIEFVSSLLLGIYLGLVCLFTLDERKRFQGSIAAFGSAVGLLALGYFDVLLPNISFVDPYNWAAVAVGILVAGSFELNQLLEVIRSNTTKSREDLSFVVAGWALFSYVSIVLCVALFQAIGVGTARPLIDIPTTAATVYLLFGFVKYTSQVDIAVIGPRESGKSLLLLGLYLSFRDRGIAGPAQGYMQSLLSQADSITPGDDFPIANTYDLEELWFFVTKGGIFPKRLKLSVTDHTGELLTRLGADLEEANSIRDRLEIVRIKYRKYNPLLTLTPGGEANYRLFEHQVRTADAVLLLIDVEKLQGSDVAFIRSLQTIGKRAQENGANVYLVATKCDLLIDDFSPIAENPLNQGLDREFRHETEQRLRKGYGLVDDLCTAVGVDTIHPVYYETERHNERYIPKLDDTRSLQYQGMDELGETLLDGLE